MGDTSRQGMISQTAILNRLVQLGYEVLLPWSPHLGYDLAYHVEKEELHFGFFVHKQSQLVRIQCKTARLAGIVHLLYLIPQRSLWGVLVYGRKKRADIEAEQTGLGYIAPTLEKYICFLSGTLLQHLKCV